MGLFVQLHTGPGLTSVQHGLLAPSSLFYCDSAFPNEQDEQFTLQDCEHVGARGMYVSMCSCVFMCVEVKDNLGHLPLSFLT